MITYSTLKYGSVGRASGLDVESCDFLTYCQDSVRQLMRRGNYWATVRSLHACVRKRDIVWPRHVGTVLALNVCNHPIELANHWYKFMPLDQSHLRDACDFDLHGRAGNLVSESLNTIPVFNPIEAEGFTLRFFPSNPADAGKTITVYGSDVNGQTIRTQRADTTWQDGVQLNLAVPYVETPMAVRHVTRIAKDETVGQVNAYQWNVAGGFLLNLGSYEPTELNPEYVVSRLVSSNVSYDSNCLKQIQSLVKLNFIPFKFDNDLVQIDNEDAIRDFVLSIRQKEQGNMGASKDYEVSALRELNKQMQEKFPLEQFQVSYRQYGSARLQKIMGGFI